MRRGPALPSHLLCDLEYADLSEPQLPPRKWIGCSLPGPLRIFSELMQEWGLEQYSHWSSINPLGGGHCHTQELRLFTVLILCESGHCPLGLTSASPPPSWRTARTGS